MTAEIPTPPLVGPPVGLFGGSFNPPHMAHVLVVAWALAGGEVREVWVIPNGGHPFGKELAPFDERMEMCRRAFACFGQRVRVLDIESAPGVHYTIDTLRELARAHPENRWRWIMGSDALDEIHHWRAYDEITAMAPPLIIPRRGHAEDRAATFAGFALPDLSSTLVRRLLSEGRIEALVGLVPGGVIDWIRQRGLYRAK